MIHDFSHYGVIYHYWNDTEVPAWKDESNTVLLAISTLRHFHPNVPVYVIDCSNSVWNGWDKILKFNVIPWQSKDIEVSTNKIERREQNFSSKTLKRVFDIWDVAQQIDQRHIVFSDSDIYWMRPLFPLIGDTEQFCCSSNSGLFYFDKKSEPAIGFFDSWRALILLGCQDLKVQKRIERQSTCRSFICETALRYLRKCNGSYTEIGRTENFPVTNPRGLQRFRDSYGTVKGIHLKMWLGNRAWACRRYLEIARNVDTRLLLDLCPESEQLLLRDESDEVFDQVRNASLV